MEDYDYKTMFNWLACNGPEIEYQKDYVTMTFWQHGDNVTVECSTLEDCILQALALEDDYNRSSDQEY